MDTIFALSSGKPPAAIAVMRISGSRAMAVGEQLAGSLPAPRHAAVRTLRDADGATLDQALVIAFPGPRTATGEDLVELHLHGGKAVIAAVERAIGAIPGLRLAQPGEFTRRALENGRVDVAQAEGLADLLNAETEGARRAAIAATEGAVGQALAQWHHGLSDIAARIEAAIDYSEEGDVDEPQIGALQHSLLQLGSSIGRVLARPSVERLRDGPIVVLAGPPNAGKSSLFNALVTRDAAIVSDIAGTTRDVIEAAVIRNGRAFRLVDTAGLRESADLVEQIGVQRATAVANGADLVLWLGEPADRPGSAMQLAPKCDLFEGREGFPVSISRPETIEGLWHHIVAVTEDRSGDDVYLHRGQHQLVSRVRDEIDLAARSGDLVLMAEHVRLALVELSPALGVNATEAMLDALFSRFCVGK